MINVAGLGIAGSYLLRRFSQEGIDAKGYDPKRPDYYIPCGYATNIDRLSNFAKRAGLEVEKYVLFRSHDVTFSGNNFEPVIFPAKGIGTFDKNLFESDMTMGLNIIRESLRPRDRAMVIDATGVSRSILGTHSEDNLMYAMEYVTGSAKHDDFYFYFFQKGEGYYWEFPLGNRFHVGAGGLSRDTVFSSLKGINGDRITGRKIRMKPLLNGISSGNVIGVGESIGLVSPITGEGILPALESAEFLVQCIKKHDDIDEIKLEYEKLVRSRFGYYNRLYDLVSAIQGGKRLKFSATSAALSARKDLLGFGIDFSLGRVIRHFL